MPYRQKLFVYTPNNKMCTNACPLANAIAESQKSLQYHIFMDPMPKPIVHKKHQPSEEEFYGEFKNVLQNLHQDLNELYSRFGWPIPYFVVTNHKLTQDIIEQYDLNENSYSVEQLQPDNEDEDDIQGYYTYIQRRNKTYALIS